MSDDVYSGFNETAVSTVVSLMSINNEIVWKPTFVLKELMNDASVREAIGKSSHGRRIPTAAPNRLATAAGRVQTATAGLRPSTGTF